MTNRSLLIAAVGIFALVCVGGAVALALRPHTESYRMRAESMSPTLHPGDRLTVNHDAYEDAAPAIGDVVVIHPPTGALENRCGEELRAGKVCARPTPERADVEFVHRIVAAPGDRVKLEAGRVVRNGRPAQEPYVGECEPAACDFPVEAEIPDGHYLVLGDNRGASDDSRFWGPVPLEAVVGRVDDCNLLGSCSPRR